jgi:hypothetical protein
MIQHIRGFFSALACLKITKHFKPALWTMVGSMLFIAASQTTAYGLEFPMTTRLTLPASKNLTVGGTMPSVALISQTSEMALVAYAMEQVNQARKELGAKRVAKAIMNTEYSWGDEQYSCLNRLWTKESNWNYKARNKRTGAHGIPQALPADKMDVVGTDWRTNPVTQIRWGLRYIDIRYDTPCGAWAKFKRSRYY